MSYHTAKEFAANRLSQEAAELAEQADATGQPSGALQNPQASVSAAAPDTSPAGQLETGAPLTTAVSVNKQIMTRLVAAAETSRRGSLAALQKLEDLLCS